MDEVIKKTIDNLEKNNFVVSYFNTREEALPVILEDLKPATSIGRGGSVTIEEIGLIDKVQESGLPFFDYKEMEDRKRSLTADYYLCSTNAITENGWLVNIDGSGNRTAAMSFGPNKVFIVTGTNKIVKDVEAGLERIANVAAPPNAKRLGKKTPCATTGRCSDCSSPERICRKTLISTKPKPERIYIYLINEELGY